MKEKVTNVGNKLEGKTILIIVLSIIIIILLIVVIVLSAIISGTKTNILLQNTTMEHIFNNDVDVNNLITITYNEESTESTDSIKVKMNEEVSKKDKYEFTITGYEFTKKVLPPNTSGYYSFYEAKEDGQQLLDVKFTFKNNDSTKLEFNDRLNMKIKYNEKYEYTGFCIMEDGTGDFRYQDTGDIAPLTTGKLHYIFNVPDEVANGTESVVLVIKSGKNSYEVILR